jgi:hypothetical protein
MRNELRDRTNGLGGTIRSLLVVCFVAGVAAAPARADSIDVIGFLRSSYIVAFSNDFSGGGGLPFTVVDAASSTVPESGRLILLGHWHTGYRGSMAMEQNRESSVSNSSPTMTKTTVGQQHELLTETIEVTQEFSLNWISIS